MATSATIGSAAAIAQASRVSIRVTSERFSGRARAWNSSRSKSPANKRRKAHRLQRRTGHMVEASRTIKVNEDPREARLDRSLDWHGLVMKAENPLPFVPVITSCKVIE